MENIRKEAAELVSASIGIAAKEDRENFLKLLQKSGFLVNENSTEGDLIDAALYGIKENARFKKDFENYLVQMSKEQQLSANGDDLENDITYEDPEFFNYVDSDFFNFNIGKSLNSIFVNKKGEDTAFGKALRNNTDAMVKVGIEALGSAITNRANRSTNKQAIEMSRQETERLYQENIAKGLISTGSSAITTPPPSSTTGGTVLPPPPEKKNKWVLPVVIVGGIVVLGVVTYFLTKKKGVAPTKA